MCAIILGGCVPEEDVDVVLLHEKGEMCQMRVVLQQELSGCFVFCTSQVVRGRVLGAGKWDQQAARAYRVAQCATQTPSSGSSRRIDQLAELPANGSAALLRPTATWC